jgi:uncharacterized protein YbaP (TraB family)
MLWQVADTAMQMVASIHVMDSSPPPLSPRIEQAYTAAQRIAFETRLDAKPDLSSAVFAQGQRLSQVLQPAVFEATQARWLALGLPEQELEISRPWFVGIRLQLAMAAQRGFLWELGVDKYFWTRAINDGRDVIPLETAESALTAFASAPLQEQTTFLSYFALSADTAMSELLSMVAEWRAGRYEVFERVLSQRLAMCPRLFKELVVERNGRWIPKLLAMARDRTPTLVVVGVLHFAGESGLPALLAHHGLQVSRWEGGRSLII